jgi:hypothetical protein
VFRKTKAMLRQNVWIIFASLEAAGSVSAQDGSRMVSVIPAPSRDLVIIPAKAGCWDPSM